MFFFTYAFVYTVIKNKLGLQYVKEARHGRDHMVVGFITT